MSTSIVFKTGILYLGVKENIRRFISEPCYTIYLFSNIAYWKNIKFVSKKME